MKNYDSTIKPITTRQIAIILLLSIIIGMLIGIAIYSIRKNRALTSNVKQVNALRSQKIIRNKIPKSNASEDVTKFTFILHQ